jgi:hypothetical protein
MNLKYVVAGAFVFSAIIGWNLFLIQRDAELFRAIEHRNAQIEQLRTH